MNLVTKWRAEEHEAFEREQLRQAYLRGSMPKNAPELLRPTRCRVLKAFSVAGRRIEVGEVVELARHDAESLAAIGEAELL